MPLLRNVTISTGRGSFNSSTGVTSAEVTYLTNVPAHIQPRSARSLSIHQEHVISSEFELNVDSGTDIAIGDVIFTITLPDGVTNWPGDASFGANVWWRVVYIAEQAAGLLPSRMVYVERWRKGGPSH